MSRYGDGWEYSVSHDPKVKGYRAFIREIGDDWWKDVGSHWSEEGAEKIAKQAIDQPWRKSVRS